MKALLRFRIITIISITVFLIGALITHLRHEYLIQQDTVILNEHFDTYSLKSYLAIQRGLELELQRLQSLVSVFDIPEFDTISRGEFDHFAQVIMASGHSIQAMQWLPLVKGKDRAAFEASIQAEGFKDFQIKSIVNGKFEVAEPADEYAVVNYIYPFQGNEGALGLDTYSSQSQKDDLIKAAKTGETLASRPIELVQLPGSNPAVILYQPVYTVTSDLKGYVALILRIDKFLEFLEKRAVLERSIRYEVIDSQVPELPYLKLPKNHFDIFSPNYRSHKFLIPIGGKEWNFIIHGDLSQLPEYEAYGKVGHTKQVVYGLLVSLLVAIFLFVWLKSRKEKLLTQRNLREQEIRYEELFEQSSDAFYVLDCNGNIVNVNSESAKALGYSKAQLLTMNFAQIDQKYIADNISELCMGIEAGGKILFESRHLRRDGTDFPVEVSARKCMMANNYVISLFVRDLTERLTFRELSIDHSELQKAVDQYTKELAEQKKAFETVFEKSADGIFISEGRHVLDCNEATVRIFGYSSKQELLRLPNRVFAPKYQPDGESSHRKGFRMLQICMKQGSHRYEWVNKRANGEEFWADVVLTRLEYYGRPVIHIAFRDISKRKKLQAEAIAAKETAIKASQEKSEFLANISHEIRTPLHGILSYAQMGESRVHSLSVDKMERYFKSIHVSAQRLLLLLNDVLDSAKLESGLMRYDFAHQDIQKALEECVQEQAALAAEKNIELVLTGLSFTAYFDHFRIVQVLSNLLSNAIRFTPNDKKILIKVETANPNEICISITDEGPGIPEEELSDIFKQFIQSRENQGHVNGTGLGLAICREIIKAHNGKIWVENDLQNGKVLGAVFKFTLPVSKEILLQDESENQSEALPSLD